MGNKLIYLDNAATTKAYNEVICLLECYARDRYFNPSALYGSAAAVARDLARARESVAALLGARPEEIVFTGSGSESDNMAIFGCARSKGRKLVTCVSEHAAVYNCFKELQNRGYCVEFVGSDRWGGVDFNALRQAITPDTQLVSIMHVNNETGCVNDIKAIAKLVKSIAPQCAVHSDGVQAYGKLPLSLHDAGVDLYSFSGHKIHAVKGVGGLYCRKGFHLPPLVYGGGQERGLRSGTENIPGIMALAKAGELIAGRQIPNSRLFKQLKTLFLQKIHNTMSDIIVNSPTENAADNIVSLSIAGIKAEVLLHMLEGDGIVLGLGSACSARQRTTRLTSALGLEPRYAEGTIRVSFSGETEEGEVVFAAERIAEHTQTLRKTMGRKA